MIRNSIIIVLVALVLNIFASISSRQPVSIEVSPYSMVNSDKSSPFVDMLFTMLTWEKFLANVESHPRTVVLWSGLGGWKMVENAVVMRLKEIQTRKQVDIVVVGFTASAHALAVCELPNTYHTNGAILMFHIPITGDDKEFDRSPSTFDACVARGVLDANDVKLLTGVIPMEIWITYYPDNKPHKTYRPDRRAVANGGTAI